MSRSVSECRLASWSMTDHLIILVNHSGLSLLRKSGSCQTNHTYMPYWLRRWVVVFEALFGPHDILILGKSPIKWRQRPDMTIAVDWNAKLQLN